MVIPVTGALILVIGVWFFVFSPRLLYAAMIVSVPFSATAVFNLSWGGEEKGVAAWLFFGALWVFREFISGVPPWHTQGWFSSRQARYGLLGFLAAVIVSLCVPAVLNGTAWVPDPRLVSSQAVPLRFGLYNVTQTAYLAFGVLLAILVAAENCRTSRLFYTVRLYLCSCTFAAAWGLFELWCDLTGHAYPAYVFNTNADVPAAGYRESLALGVGSLGRVSSVALEPSVLAEELLLALVVLLVSLRLKRPVLSRKWDYAALALIAATLVASTSTTAYAGVLIALLVAAVALSRAGKPSKGYFVLAGAAVGVGALVAVAVPVVREVSAAVVLNKFQAGSGLERLRSVELAAQDFLRYPVFGAGWHTVACWDLMFLLLANTGLVGFMAFASFLFPVFRDLWTSAAKGKASAIVLLPTVTLTILLSEVSGLTYSAGYVWLALGLGAGAVVASRSERALQADRKAKILFLRSAQTKAVGNPG
jgi:hypothetical protein